MKTPDLNVVPLKAPVDPEFTVQKILETALTHNLESCLVLGVRDSSAGRSLYVSSSEGVGPEEVNWLLDLAKQVNMAEYL